METLNAEARTRLAKFAREFEPFTASELFATWAGTNTELSKEDATTAFWAEHLKLSAQKQTFNTLDQPKPMPLAIDGDTFRATKFPKVEWIVNKMIPKGSLVAISGIPGSYKSFFALWLATRTAAGLPLFEIGTEDEPYFCEQKTEKTATMFIEEENTAIMTHARYVGFKTPPSNALYFRIDQNFKVKKPEWLKALMEDVDKYKIGLIIMDPFSSVMGLEDENDNAEVSAVMDLIRKTFLDRGVTVVFIHHPSKNAEGGANLRGAGDILGKCDVHLHLEKDEIDRKQVIVSFRKMRLISDDEVTSFKMRASGDSGLGDMSFRYLGEAVPKAEEERNALGRQILALMTPGESYQKSVLASEVGQSHRNKKFISAWQQLEATGKLKPGIEKKNGHPLYYLA
jgi:archaellum biogenesis ATPase FlaH